jgi:hypothetical protein
MASELLDFVMSLVRDPDAAARYAGNPEQAIADAHLTDVTSVDVNDLIPVVSESMGAPAFGAESATDGNVWASGAATAAFDAFSEHLPAPAVVDTHGTVLDQPTVTPPDTGVDPFGAPAADFSGFDALDQPLAQPEVEVHDVAPAADPTPFDTGFDHPSDHHGFADPGAGGDGSGLDTPLH